jgi:hypothetical protein
MTLQEMSRAANSAMISPALPPARAGQQETERRKNGHLARKIGVGRSRNRGECDRKTDVGTLGEHDRGGDPAAHADVLGDARGSGSGDMRQQLQVGVQPGRAGRSPPAEPRRALRRTRSATGRPARERRQRVARFRRGCWHGRRQPARCRRRAQCAAHPGSAVHEAHPGSRSRPPFTPPLHAQYRAHAYRKWMRQVCRGSQKLLSRHPRLCSVNWERIPARSVPPRKYRPSRPSARSVPRAGSAPRSCAGRQGRRLPAGCRSRRDCRTD